MVLIPNCPVPQMDTPVRCHLSPLAHHRVYVFQLEKPCHRAFVKPG